MQRNRRLNLTRKISYTYHNFSAGAGFGNYVHFLDADAAQNTLTFVSQNTGSFIKNPVLTLFSSSDCFESKCAE